MKSDFQYLNQPKFRQKFEKSQNIFVAEGLKVTQRALALNYEPRTVIGTTQWLSALGNQVDAFEIHELSAAEVSKITGYEVHRGLLATFERKPIPSLEELLCLHGPLVLLENLVDLENLGTIFRTATALGISGILLNESAPDPYYRRCIKASMGATLQMPFAYYSNPDELHRPLVGFTPAGSARLTEMHFGGSEILAFGSEGDGLSESILKICKAQVSIPMSNSVDSLNVAASAAIGIWEYLQRVTSTSG